MSATGDADPKGKRNLVRWDDDKDKQLLLCLQFACVKAGIRIPWEKVASQMGPKFSSGACIQHLAKLRNRMKEEGIPVPPPLPRGMVTTTPSRVYSQPTAGKRRRGSSNAEDEDEDEFAPLNPAEESPKPASKKRKVTKKEPGIKEEDDTMPDLYDSDEEYGAKQKKAPKSKAKAKKPAPKKNARRKSTSQDAEPSIETTPTPTSAPRTRGVRKNYAHMEAPIEDDEDVKDNNIEEGEPSQIEGADDVGAEETVIAEEDEIKAEEAGAAMEIGDVPATPASVAAPIPQHPAQFQLPPITPTGQAGNTQVLRGGQGAFMDPLDFSGMHRQPQWPPHQWGGYNMTTPNAGAQNYNTPNNGYGLGNQGSFTFPSTPNDQKTHNIGGFDPFGAYMTPTGMPILNSTMPATSLSFGTRDNMQQLDMTNFAQTASFGDSRTNSKDSVKSQETLMGAPDQNNLEAGQELELSTLDRTGGPEWNEFDGWLIDDLE